ncbi:Bile salt-activated lipase [Mizuhopecten yessoensis]|uniref:Bile salt-activated lipase n=2 Tax=Mizuhopecten yessoensis TaxID=6573 RepID=A0A210PTR3_MIZYE|nr:Bile salt-activated lipase [Mizuhopecten yessoensis]
MPEVLLSNSASEENKFFRSLDAIYGTSNTEGISATIVAYGLQKRYGFNATLEIPNIVLHDEFAPTISRLFYNNNEQVSRAIYDEYSSEDTLEQSKNMLDLFTDYVFLAATVGALNSHSLAGSVPSGNTFQYLFTGEGIIEGPFVLPVYFKGAWHGAELSFLFGLNGPGNVLNKTADGNALRKKMISYWTNFAKHG